MNIDLIAPKSLTSYRLKERYLPLMKKTLTLLEHSLHADVDVLITTNHTIRSYNHKYRQKDQATDVLSFGFQEQPSKIVGQPIHLGQIVISHQKAKSQAVSYGHTIEREFTFLFVHGLLHLLGYNHETESDEKIMLSLQDKILGKRIPHGKN